MLGVPRRRGRLLAPRSFNSKPVREAFVAAGRRPRAAARGTQRQRRALTQRSDFVVLVADADDAGNVVFFLFLLFEEGVVGLVLAEVDIVVAEIG